MSRRVLAGVAAVVIVGSVGAAAATRWLGSTEEDEGGATAAGLTAMFQDYGNTSGTWLGADRTASVPLAGGRTLWLFSDTFLGRPAANGARPAESGLINNSAIVQQDGKLGRFFYGGTATAPEALVPAAATDEFHWIGDAVAGAGDTVQVLANRYRRSGAGPLDHQLIGTVLAGFSTDALTPGPVRELPLGDRVSWGSEVMPDGGHTYVYGTEVAGKMKFAHLARVAGTDLGGAWEFWTGSAWSTTESESARLLSGVGTNYGVRRVGNQYVLVTHENNLIFSADFVAYTADNPAGPFTGPHYLFSAPEVGSGHIVYDADLHQDLSPDGRLLISYNVNNLDEAVTYADSSIYRPRFVEAAWPPAGPSGKAPAVPQGLTAAADGAGTASLSWQPVTGDDVTYRVWRRDVTGGQTHFVRLPGDGPGAATQFRTDFLTNDHEYEFAVTATTEGGESERSAVALMKATVPPPDAPSGVTVKAHSDDGRVTVRWNTVPFVQLFKVFHRDLTAGQEKPEPAGSYPGTSATVGPLVHGHDYEITVVAVGGGGDSKPSDGARVVPSVARPPAPGQPVAEARADGSVHLTWAGVAPGLSYQVFRRDLSTTNEVGPPGLAKDTRFDTGKLIHGHEYEFTVAAVNSGGVGEQSPPVRVRAEVAAPTDSPARLRVEARPPGVVALSWQSTGAKWYRIYRRDLTAGQTEFVKEEIPVEGTSSLVHNLANGHQYDFAVAAIGDGGEGPRSKPVRKRMPSSLPSGVTARSDEPGAVTVTWREPWTGINYRVQLRDATAGEDWRTDPFPASNGRFQTALLTSGHRYEFRLQSPDGDNSATAAVTVK
ncbi:fibronectin type III domain-containing protein [Actinoplanes couchii]|uniref:fibronectin type III domain-containing protein n=1 Tax=Actinoplanes couchii TaxID=403638 RepID=UPI001941B7A8|nr:fibronectin type III domain-containing protein [Actinoplanes couchii]MDR6322268.1 hypothetical protein [Actinoplanes couchii]